jgi:hypothetical protein
LENALLAVFLQDRVDRGAGEFGNPPGVHAMKKDRFWSIVEATRLDPPTRRSDVDIGERNRRYKLALARLKPQEIVDYQLALEERLIEAYRWDLWAAATLINDGCNETSFRHFRSWLVAQGQEVFEAALRDPESLAENAELGLEVDAHYPAFWSIPGDVYREKTGKNTPELDLALPVEPAGKKLSDVPVGLSTKFPRLFKAFYREEWDEAGTQYEEYKFPPPLKTPVPPMEDDRFWWLIDESRKQARKKKLRPGQDFIDAHITELRKLLRELTPEELIAYNNRFQYYWNLSYRWDLWGVAYWLHAGCSDDGFIDFRACLISLGKKWYFQVLDDPDSLTDLVGRDDVPYMQAEGFQYVDTNVYREKTGYDGMPEVIGEEHHPSKPKGERFDYKDDEEMRKRFPKLVARYPDMGD